jgi:formamidopyrimidine-DNA glycosylase
MQLLPTGELASDAFLARLGPEPLDDGFTWQVLRQQLGDRSSRPIKAALLDQGVVAGIGNIYADESLFLAGLAPQRLVSSLNDGDVQRLWAGIRQCLSESIEAGGSSMRDYVSALGLRGDYLEQARVFGRTGEACPRCGAPIEKTRVAGRGTHWCPRCQK